MKFLSLCLLEIDFVQDTKHTQIVLFHLQLLSLSALYTMFEISEGIRNAWWKILIKTKVYQGWITILQAPVWGRSYNEQRHKFRIFEIKLFKKKDSFDGMSDFM